MRSGRHKKYAFVFGDLRKYFVIEQRPNLGSASNRSRFSSLLKTVSLPTYTVAPALALAATDSALELEGVVGGLAIGVLVGVLLFLGVPNGVPNGVPKGEFIGDGTFVSIVR